MKLYADSSHAFLLDRLDSKNLDYKVIHGHLKLQPLYSGQALRMLKRNQSAEEVINEIMIEAKEYLSSIDFD
jgi:hypothetical protein